VAHSRQSTLAITVASHGRNAQARTRRHLAFIASRLASVCLACCATNCAPKVRKRLSTVVRRYPGCDDTDRDAARLAKSKIDALTMEMDNQSQAIAELGLAPALVDSFKRKKAERKALRQTLASRRIGSEQYAEVAHLARQRMAELREILAGSTAAYCHPLWPITVEQRDGDYYASFDDVSDRLIATTVGDVSLRMVAGVGFEPTTFGL
jgi:site-specific DNA recombinase